MFQNADKLKILQCTWDIMQFESFSDRSMLLEGTLCCTISLIDDHHHHFTELPFVVQAKQTIENCIEISYEIKYLLRIECVVAQKKDFFPINLFYSLSFFLFFEKENFKSAGRWYGYPSVMRTTPFCSAVN
jgi:hypothetical protein